jgi:hypothetical protein
LNETATGWLAGPATIISATAAWRPDDGPGHLGAVPAAFRSNPFLPLYPQFNNRFSTG